MKELSVAEQKKILVDILKSLHKFCEENNLTYFLDCGTLLGCIRHHGFIPWDDDIDILMPRNDYEKFIKSYEDSGFTLFHHTIQSDYYYQYAKLSKDGTYINEFSVPNIQALGVNIDIFVIDGLPNGLILRRIHQDTLFFLSKYRAFMILLRKRFQKIAFLFRWKWVVHLVNFMGKWYSPQKNKYCGNIIATSIRHKEIPSECFDSATLGIFEASEFRIPVGYHEYLTRLYGDYMELPSRDKQNKTHHSTAFGNDDI